MKQVRRYHVELVRESSKLYDIDTKCDSAVKAQETIRTILQIEKWHNEKFGMVCLDNQNEMIGIHIVSEGSIAETAVYPREIAVRALLNNAAGVIVFHNHPANSTRPSTADIESTKMIKKALDTLQIRLLDHFIFTETEFTSFAEKGLL